MAGFSSFRDHFAAEAQSVFGETAVPIVFALATNGVMLTFSGFISAISEHLVLFGHVLAFGTAAWAAYATWKASRSGNGSKMDAAKAAGTAAAAASKASPYVLILTLITLGGYLLYSVISSRRVDAAPLAIMAAPAAKTRKKKTDDDAGGDDVEAAEVPDGAPKWMVSAYELLGVSERTSRGGSNPVVSAMFEYTQLGAKVDARKVPWCAAFVNAMLERNGYPGTKSAMARSFLKWGVGLEAPRPGCIVVIWRGEYDNGENGHVFFYTREDALYVYGVGGNQGDAVSEAKFHKSKVLGYRWPRKAIASRTNIGVAVAGTATTGAVAINAAQELLPAPAAENVAKVGEVATKAGEGAAKAGEVLAKAQEPLQKAADALQGTRIAKYLVIGLSVVTIAGLVLAYIGRRAIRNEHGI